MVRRGLSTFLFLLGLGALVSCERPRISEYEPHRGIITGTVLYAAPEPIPGHPCLATPARGNAYVTLFRYDQPPPPEGTSSPVNFVVVPESKLFGPDALREDGVFAASFTIPAVEAGVYQIRAFLDADGDFNPTVPLLAQPTAGDVGGGYVDASTRAFLPVAVDSDRETAQIVVSIGQRLPVERPAFAITSSPSYSVPMTAPGSLVLEAHPIERAQVKMEPGCSKFIVQYMDLDKDGEADDTNSDHLPDLFPRVLLRKRAAEGDTPGTTVLVPTAMNPFPFFDALKVSPQGVPADLIELMVLPVAVERSADGERVLPAIPPGDYETIVVSGTGQTWQVPNDLDAIQVAGGPDPTQSQTIQMRVGPVPPGGSIAGRLSWAATADADAYVFAFRADNPPPPAGTGRPVAFTSVPSSAFEAMTGGMSAPYTLSGLADGTYLVSALLDVDGDFSPLVSLVAQPSAGDVGAVAAAPVNIISENDVTGIDLTLNQPFLFDRPAFALDREISISRRELPISITIRPHAIDVLGISEASARVPVGRTGADLDDDNLPDLLPRVLLTQMATEGEVQTAPDDPEGVIIPGIVDPIPFLAALGSGTTRLPADALTVIVPPVALRRGAGGALEPVGLPPPGRYRVHVLSATGQTWSVPSELDAVFARLGTALEDETQGTVFHIDETPVPAGRI